MQIGRRLFLAGSATAAIIPSLSRVSFAQAGHVEPNYLAILESRNRFGRVCHLLGDSIMRGFALGRFWDGGAVDPTTDRTTATADRLNVDHPLYAWNSISSCMNAIIRENGLSRLGIGYLGLADADNVRTLVNADVIRAGDWVVFEDAGSHRADPVGYFRMVREWRKAATDRVATHCLLMTMFDYQPLRGRFPNTEYDKRYRIADGRMISINMATKMAANSIIQPSQSLPGSTRVIDMNRSMDAWRRACLRQGVDTMHQDGIHPNVWGQWLMVCEIFKAMGYPRLRTLRIDREIAVAKKNWRMLGYGTTSPQWTPDRSALWLRHLFGQA